MKNPMNYGKAKGIILLGKYLPKITPFKDIDIVNSLEEWESVKDKYGSFATHRTDMPIGKSMKNAVSGTNGFASETPALIKKVNEQSPDGVVLLMSTKEPGYPRYLYDGGFNAIFTIEDNLIIELVGKAFDGHELTQGLAVHERFIIPWDEVLFIEKRIDLMKNKSVVKFQVSQGVYTEQRRDRIAFLTDDCHYDATLVNANVPEEYKPLGDNLISGLLNEVVFELTAQKTELLKDGLRQFGVQGNFVNSKVQPWEIFRTERWL